MAEEFIPKWVAWETTQKCNLKCVHCRCSSDMTSSEGDFTTEEGKKLLKEIADFSKPVVVLSGGEPLMRKDIFELAGYGTSLGLRMCMATNGALVTDEVCEEMKKAEIRMVSLSLFLPQDDSYAATTTHAIRFGSREKKDSKYGRLTTTIYVEVAPVGFHSYTIRPWACLVSLIPANDDSSTCANLASALDATC